MESYRAHFFNIVCYRHGIERRLAKLFHVWTSGQLARMKRTIKQGIIRALQYHIVGQLQDHTKDYICAFNSACPEKGKHLLVLSSSNSTNSRSSFQLT
ncbi:hypothetical protein EAW52_25480 [Pseudomonas sp. LTJR-52]|uniref:hypothetical protein n=1 Tax=Pseudomonas sp. LTJR-52 TaxID=2479392 RepID=UPI000EFBB15D|nr:hypothetical protein [Pseudomonas sp. LTJR-52]AYN97035.1 hypothetical protein EAW52_25480 [Pseudomonas sp. LTJR-52]